MTSNNDNKVGLFTAILHNLMQNVSRRSSHDSWLLENKRSESLL